MEKKDKKETDEDKKGIVESFLEGIPMFGDFFKELGKTETFQERFKEVNEQIEESLRTGKRKKWNFEANIAVRPIFDKIKENTSELSMHDDYFYGKKDNKLTLAVKVPKEDVDLEIIHKTILINADDFEKTIELPDYYKEIKKKQYKNGILVLELTK